MQNGSKLRTRSASKLDVKRLHSANKIPNQRSLSSKINESPSSPNINADESPYNQGLSSKQRIRIIPKSS